MKINPSVGFGKYQSYVKKVGSDTAGQGGGFAAAQAAAAEAGNTDKIVISEDAALRAEMGRVTASIAGEVSAAAGAAKMQQLREAVQAGNYSVSSAVLADAILGKG